MSRARGSSKRLARQMAKVAIGWWYPRRSVEAQQAEIQQLLDEAVQDENLQPVDFAAMAQGAAMWLIVRSLVVVMGVLVMLVLIIGIAVEFGLSLWASGLSQPERRRAPTEEAVTAISESTSIPAPWAFAGHIYRYGTQEGLADAKVYLDVLSGDAWQEGVVSDTSALEDGSFSVAYELPAGFEGEMRCRLRVTPPSGWNYIEGIQDNGWTWASSTTPDILEGSFGSGEAIGAVTFQSAIKRTFTGVVYFEGESAPPSVTVGLDYQDATGTWSVVGTQDVIRHSVDAPRQILTATFTLEHRSIRENERYRVSITPPGGEVRDWVVGAPPDIGGVEDSTVVLTPGLQTDVGGIVFAGPLPITLTYETAIFEPSYDPAAPGFWRDETVGEEVNYPFATREDRDTPRGMQAYWPVYLPGGNGYEVWVAIPGPRSSAVVSYTLFSDEGGRPGIEIPGGVITEVVQCRNDQEGDEWVLATTYPPEAIGAGGLFWLVVDESRAYWPEGCLATDGNPYQFRMPVWEVEVRRGQQ